MWVGLEKRKEVFLVVEVILWGRNCVNNNRYRVDCIEGCEDGERRDRCVYNKVGLVYEVF